MNNKNPFKGIAIFLTLVLAVLGLYAFHKYLDYYNNEQSSSYETAKNAAVQSQSIKDNSQPEITEAIVTFEEENSPDFLWNYSKKWGYSCLSNEEKDLYLRICEAAKEERTAVNARGLFVKHENFNKILNAVKNDNPQFLGFYDKAECSYSIASSYITFVTIKYFEGDDYKNLESAARAILSQAEKQPTDYLKVKYVHDFLINSCSYNLSANNKRFNYSAAGPILHKTGVCEGYSKAFCYLIQSIGIPCLCVSGTATNNIGETEGHMWNMVKLEGNWYNVDVTWDDPVTNTGEDVLQYDYFLIGSSFNLNHVPDANIELPIANSSYKNF